MVGDELAIIVRIERTESELDRLRAAIESWLVACESRDVDDSDPTRKVGRHKTQLETIRSVLIGAISEIKANLGPVGDEPDVGVVYARCRDFDEAVVWVRRIWEYFRDKFDQRTDSQLRALLKGADEVVWSCFRPVFLKTGKTQGPVPLSYVEPQYSPAAVQADRRMPPPLRMVADIDFLDDYVKSMPVPILRLPPWCVDEPWWLVYLGHEVGHHIQYQFGLVGHFADGLKRAATDQGFSATDARRWEGWSKEVFADVFSVVAMGSAAIRALAEAERGTSAEMAAPKQEYPAPVIRLALAQSVARRLGLSDPDALPPGLDLEAIAATDPTSRDDWRVVEAVVDFALGPLPEGLGTLPGFFDLKPLNHVNDPAPAVVKAVKDWGRFLATDRASRERTLENPRLVASGSLRAWADMAQLPDRQSRLDRRTFLARRTTDTLLRSGPLETRPRLPSGLRPELGPQLAKDLLKHIRTHRSPDSGGH